MRGKIDVPAVSADVPYSETDRRTREQVALWLRGDLPLEKAIGYVTEKIRRRNPHPLPCKNLGGALLFSRIEIQAWLDSCERPTRALPPRGRKKAA